MSRKIRQHKAYHHQPVLTSELRADVLWTEKQLDDFLGGLDFEVGGWQREQLLKFGSRRQLGVAAVDVHPHHRGRSAGRNMVQQLAFDLAVERGHTVVRTTGGYEIAVGGRVSP